MPTLRGASSVNALLTVGHGTAGQDELARLLRTGGVERVVDVRRYPGSRAHPHVAREALTAWLPESGIGYRWEPRLGGRRRVPPGEISPDTWWTVEAFRAYAGHTRTQEFRDALGDVLDEAQHVSVAVLCSEGVWWRCHRRLIADVTVLAHGVPVTHLMHDGALRAHPPAAGARLHADGRVVWDGA